MRRVGLVLIAALALLAAVPAEGAAPLKRQTIPGLGLSIGVPADWKTFDYRKVANSEAVARLAKENPNLAALFTAIRDPKSGVRFFAADTAHASGGFATNVNVVIEKVPSGLTATDYADAAAGQLETLSALIKPIRRTNLRLQPGPAVRLRYGLRFTLNGRPQTVSTTQYAFVVKTTAYVVTYTTLPSRLTKLSTLFETSAHSIRLS